MRAWMFGIGLFIASDASAACDAAITVDQVRASVKSAETAFSRVDIDRFLTATDALQVQLPCIAEAVPADLAAAVHRMQGLRMWVGRQPDRAQIAFAAARGVDPAYHFPATMIPAQHPVMKDFAALPVSTASETVPDPSNGWLRFDGAQGLERPTAVPTLVQLVESDGVVVETAYLWPGVSMLVYDSAPVRAPVAAARPTPSAAPTAAAVAPPRAPAPVQARTKKPGRTAAIGLGIGAGGVALASGAMYAMASQSGSAWADPGTPYADLAGLRETTNRRVATAGGLAAVAVGAGVGAVVAGSF